MKQATSQDGTMKWKKFDHMEFNKVLDTFSNHSNDHHKLF